jgi:RNA polymerase sigma-70 factor, ECF subfamily
LAIKLRPTQSDTGELDPEDQARLVHRYCRGDRSAFAALVQIWEHRLLTIAYRVVGNVHDAEEVRQTVLLKLAQSLPKLDDSARFAGWLRRCVVNEAVTWLRRRNSETKRRNTFDADDADDADTSPTPPEQALAAERSQRLQQALGQLDPDLRAVLSLRFDEGLTIRHIAEVLEKPPMTVHSQITRAVGQLRQRLGVESEGGIQS